MIDRLKKSAATALALIVAIAGLALTAPSASAAVYYCDGVHSGLWWPKHVAANTARCYQNPDVYSYSPTRAIQISYNACYASRYPGGLPSGRTKLNTDGVYGPETRGAVRNIQERHGLQQDGLYGPDTAMVFRVLGKGDDDVCFS